MTIVVKHKFNSAKVDGLDSTRIQPSNWNDNHDITMAAGKVLGRDSSAAGAAQELAISVDPTQQSMTPPLGTTAQRPASPSAGMMRYNSTINRFEGYTADWGALSISCFVSNTAPSNPQVGDLWWKNSDGLLYVYYNNGVLSQWVIAGGNVYLPLAGGNISGSLVVQNGLTVYNGFAARNTNGIVAAVGSAGYAAMERQAFSGFPCYDFYKIGGVEFARIIVFPSGEILFCQGSSAQERMRIDPNGNLVIGPSINFVNTQNGLVVVGDATGANPIGLIQSNGTSPAAKVIQAISASSSCTSDGIFYSYTNTSSSPAFNHINAQSGGSGTVFRVNGAGTIFAVNTAVQSVSDIRMKENIRNSTEGLSVINALRPVRFDFKEEFGGGKKDQLGFIAQEIEQVFPDAVDIWGESDDPNDPYRSVGPGSLMPVVVRALQEVSAQLEAANAKIANLEERISKLEGDKT
jgi:hypothetical protein